MTLLMNQAKLFCSSILKSTIGRFGNRCKSLEEKYSIANITVYLIFLLSCIVCYLIYDLKRALLPSFRDTPIYLAFQTPTYIYFALIVNVAIYLPTLLDILLDLKSYRDMTFQDDVDIGEEHDSLLERAFMAVINISFASVLLILRNDKDVAFYVLWFHAPQFVGNLGVVLILCRKLVPKYFSAMNILCAQFFFGLGISIAFSMFGESSGGSWLNILVAISLILTWYFLLIRISLPWLRDLWTRGVLFGKESVTIRESCALWYFISTILIIIIAPGATLAGKHFDLASTDIYDVCLVLFSFCLFGIILNTVPGRLARNAVDRERKKALANKQALVRYIGHEVRSPLNVIASGLKILQADISKLQLLEEERAVLMDTVVSMQQESEDLLKTMNDLLQLENMESSAFSIEEKVVPCSDLLKMAENCSVSAREKGINFSVRSQIGQQPVEMTAAMPLREGEPRDIERGGSEDIKEPDPEAAALSVCIDDLKMGQVVRNLITNAIKFTPAEKSITVTLREAIPADLTEEGCLVNEEKTTVTKKKKKRRVPSSDMHSGHVVFEVAAEIARENWSKMFLEFKQFDVNDLQVRVSAPYCIYRWFKYNISCFDSAFFSGWWRFVAEYVDLSGDSKAPWQQDSIPLRWRRRRLWNQVLTHPSHRSPCCSFLYPLSYLGFFSSFPVTRRTPPPQPLTSPLGMGNTCLCLHHHHL